MEADFRKFESFPATSAPLLASAFLLDGQCRKANDSFMRCRRTNDDPAQCRDKAQAVMACTSLLFRRLAASPCRALFEKYWHCLDLNNQDFIYCREEEFALHECTSEHLGMEKRLWRGRGPVDGLKEPTDRPEIDSWRYQMHNVDKHFQDCISGVSCPNTFD